MTDALEKQEDIKKLSEKALIKLEAFNESLSYDLDQLSQSQPSAITTTLGVASDWRNTQNDIQEKVANLSEKRTKQCTMISNCKTSFEKVVNPGQDITDLKTFEDQLYKIIENLKKAKTPRNDLSLALSPNFQNNVDLAQVLAKFLKQQCIVLDKHCDRYSKILDNHHMTQSVLKSQSILKEEYEICLTNITKYQLRRQLHCWNSIKSQKLQEDGSGNQGLVTANMKWLNYDINDEIENSKRLISENNVLWDKVLKFMKEF